MRARDNPFAVQRVLAIRYRLSGTTWEELLARLESLRFRAALVGPHGRGKTTLLEDLGARITERGFRVRMVTLHEGDRRLGDTQRRTLFHSLAPSDVLLLDGAEQLGRLPWLEVRTRTRAAGGLIITSHRPGLLPTLHECRTTPGLLAEIVGELTGAEVETGELFVRHQGNLREALRALYDACASDPHPRPLSRPLPPPAHRERGERQKTFSCLSPSSPGERGEGGVGRGGPGR